MSFVVTASLALFALGTPAGDFCRWVDPRIGCSENGHCQPAATTPFGLVSAGPDTGVEWWHYCGGYQWRDKRILGFSQDHVSGTVDLEGQG